MSTFTRNFLPVLASFSLAGCAALSKSSECSPSAPSAAMDRMAADIAKRSGEKIEIRNSDNPCIRTVDKDGTVHIQCPPEAPVCR